MGITTESMADAPVAGLSVTALVRQHHKALMSLLRRRLGGGSEDAADIAQEAYIRMLQYEGSRELLSPFSMLVRVALNVANDRCRADRARFVRGKVDLDDIELVSDTAPPEAQLSAQQELETLRTAIAELSARCREVFLLSRVNNLTYTQIAERCGISVKMVEKHISNALAHCARRVGRYNDGAS
jgi:RNA polymerase sigma-70 factor (ECF subfamily)